MGSKESKSELLSQLIIEKDIEVPQFPSINQLILACLLSAVIAGIAVYFLFGASPAKEIDSSKIKTPIDNSSRSVKQAPKLPQAVSTQKIPGEQILNASGYITARRVATVSAETMGLITRVDVEEGMEVEKGQILARLDDTLALVNLRLAQAQINARDAQLASIETELNEAEKILRRVSQLDENKFSSEAELTRAQTNVAKLTSQITSAKTDIRVAQLQVARQQELLADHTIRAPFSGVVTVKNAQQGEIVAPSSAGGGFTRTGICTIVDMTSLEIEVDVNESFIGRVFAGQKVVANLDAYPEWDIPASVIAIIPTANRAKATVSVRIKIEEKDARILPDMGVKVAFLKGE